MADRATSDSPLVQAQLDRLERVGAKKDMLGHDRLTGLLARLGNPHRHLPPVFHVAGTNGKGSTVAYLRAAFAAAGLRAHAFTSPHLVRLNERIRIANTLVSDAELAGLLSDVLDAVEVGGGNTTFFEATTSAALLGFSRHPADGCILEVGLGGRLDATSVVEAPAVCAIAQLGLDHQEFLGDTLEDIAREKAGIAKPGVPLVTMAYAPSVAEAVADVAAARGAPVFARGLAWDARIEGTRLHYEDARGALDLPAPALPGAHQAGNAGLALAMLRHQQTVTLPDAALAQAMTGARWPARLQRLGDGPLTRLLPGGAQVWLDGAHNVAAMEVVVDFLRAELPAGATLDVVLGTLERKDARGLLACLAQLPCHIHAVPVPGYEGRDPQSLAGIAREMGLEASAHPSPQAALRAMGGPAPHVLIVGSLYLAGQVLRLNSEWPD
ncbi:MAG: bifunctional folylpolyglutamate synthase/dihydrofolate synthase [Sphingomonadales bacterium]|nr:bifunctional folylpolyglutamate synthase/dihydrofolate synthase [Sphingomonadales bacterium]MBD3775127.1 bifunctional folylpolyglutamate synthase/dihydrofolate synthase [Paracoccaceae bacterium]